MQIRPFQSVFKIIQSPNTQTDAWQGAKSFANSPKFKSYSTTRADYMEYGSEYFQEHYASNLYFATPAPIVVSETAQTQQPGDATNASNNDNDNIHTKADDSVFTE